MHSFQFEFDTFVFIFILTLIDPLNSELVVIPDFSIHAYAAPAAAPAAGAAAAAPAAAAGAAAPVESFPNFPIHTQLFPCV